MEQEQQEVDGEQEVDVEEEEEVFLSDVHMTTATAHCHQHHHHAVEKDEKKHYWESRFVFYTTPVDDNVDCKNSKKRKPQYSEEEATSSDNPAKKAPVASKTSREVDPQQQHQTATLDADGDIVVQRSAAKHTQNQAAPLWCSGHNNDNYREVLVALGVLHHMATPLSTVGLQVWRGALRLIDLLISMQPTLFPAQHAAEPVTMLELGCGVGLAAMVAATLGANVYATELGDGILANCQASCRMNALSGAFETQAIRVKRLDWAHIPPTSSTTTTTTTTHRDHFDWDPEEWKLMLASCSYIIAADVIYVDEWTNSFVAALKFLLAHSTASRCFLALEKRLNFTLEDLDIACPAYTHFEATCLKHSDFVCSRITHVPQYSHYDCTPQLVSARELWRIELASS